EELSDASGRRRGRRAGAILEAQRRRRSLLPARLEPRGDEAVVVVAGKEDHLVLAERVGDGLQDGRRGRQGLARRPVPELERVAEDDQPVDAESFRPGTFERLGLGYDAIAEENQGLILCSISAFGSGELAARLPGYDRLLQAMSGRMSVTGEPGDGGRPLKVGAALIDMVCGLYAATGILAALHARSRTGRGQRLEVSLMDSA